MLKGWVRKQQDVNARERVRLAIRHRLEQLGMTGRAFGRHFSANDGKGHVDTWVSGLLNGQFALSLDELDEAAHILKVTTAELVKSPFETAEYLTPTEHRIIEAARRLPPSVRDHLSVFAEYLSGVVPEEIEHLREFRHLDEDDQQRIREWTRALRFAQEPLPALPIGLDASRRADPPSDAAPPGRKRKR